MLIGFRCRNWCALFFFFQAEDGIRDLTVTGVQTCALPIFVGLRLGLIFALINVVGVEFLINFGGLGQLINDLAERYDLPAMYATIGFVILVSVVFFMSLERIERWLRPAQ